MLIGAFALLLLALVLVAAELVVPSHGLLTILAALAAFASIFLAYKAAPDLALIFGALILISAPIVFYWAIRLYPGTPMGKRVMLAPPSEQGRGDSSAAPAFSEEAARLEKLVGQQGLAATFLRPSGSVEIAGARIDAISESDIIEPGTPVEVIKVSGLKVIVKPVG